MSDIKTYDVPAEWSSRAYVDEAKYRELYAASVKDPVAFWGEQGKRIHWFTPYTKVKNTTLRPAQRLDQMVRGRRHQRRLQLPRPALGDARRPGRHHLGRRQPQRRQEDHLSRALRGGLPLRQRAEGARRQEGRSRHHLSADDPGGGLRHAGLRPHRRHPLGGVRRLLAGQPGRPHRGRRLDGDRHRRRGPARRPQGAAEAQCRRRRRPCRRGGEHHRGAPHRRQRADALRPRRLL